MLTDYDENLTTGNPKTLHAVLQQSAESLLERELTEKYQSALDLYCRKLNTGKLTMGSSLLDSLIGGGVETSTFTLLYGDRRILQILVHKLLINTLLDTSRGGFASPAVYVCCSNYRKERTVLNTYYLADIALSTGINPTAAFRNIHVSMAFNPLEEYIISKATEKVVRKTGSKLILVDNIALLLCDEKMREEFPDITLTSVVGGFWEAAFRNDAALVATCREVPPNLHKNQPIPTPEGGSVLSQKAGVIVYLRVGHRRVSFAKAYLRKHPSLANREVTFTFNYYNISDDSVVWGD
jgi:DNA repair protein RadA